MGKDHSVATQQFLHASSIGRLLFAQKLNIYLMSVQETQLRLYDELERVLREFLSAVRILSKCYLPASLFPPTVLCRITSNALQMVQKKNPDYVLTIKHVTEYYCPPICLCWLLVRKEKKFLCAVTVCLYSVSHVVHPL